MANEQDLIDRWGKAYRGSSEYQNALKRDAMNKVARTAKNAAQDRQTRMAIQTAMARGDTATAQRIQMAAMQNQGEEFLASAQPSGEAAGLDEYQRNRVNDYIDQARQAGAKQFTELVNAPMGHETYGPGYLEGVANPDFSTFHPETPNARGFGMDVAAPERTMREPADRTPQAVPQTADEWLKVDPTGVLRQKFLDSKNQSIANVRKEQHLRAILPKDLSDAYGKMTAPGGMTQEEHAAFLGLPPEQQFSQLRAAVVSQSKRPPQPTPNSDAVMTGPGGAPDFLPSAPEPFTVPLSGASMTLPTTSNSSGPAEMPVIDKPVTPGRPAASLNSSPRDFLGQPGSPWETGPDNRG